MNIKQNNRKYIGSCCGNKFIILDCRNNKLNKKSKVNFAVENIIKYKVDSTLFLNNSIKADIAFDIFEKNGAESESCGNGAILISHLLKLNNDKIETRGGIINTKNSLRKRAILMNRKFSDVKKNSYKNDCIFIKFGEPHVICAVDDIRKFDLIKTGEKIQEKYPKGVNVDIIQKAGKNRYIIRTYERGVFAETKSCGTGSLSAYLAISYFNNKVYKKPIEFKSVGGSHWVSGDKNTLKLETLKKFCKIRELKS